MNTPDLLVDSHCHLDHPRFAEDREAVITRAHEAGVSHLITIGADLASSRSALDIARDHDNIFATCGVHPHEAKDAPESYLQQLRDLAARDEVVAIGEIGLDYHYNSSPREQQRQRFAEQVALAKDLDLPVVIHMRSAENDCLDILRSVGVGARGGVIHCFSSSLSFAKKALDLNMSLSIPGIVTYKKPGELPEVVRSLPLDCLMVETDAPYLAPVPHRGLRNEPAFVAATVAFMAELTGNSVADVRRTTAQTAARRFRLDLGAGNQHARIAYRIRNNLYLNITNACTLRCSFCPKQRARYVVKGHPLKLDRSPSVDEIKHACGELSPYEEVVFVGLGESTTRLPVLLEVATWLKQQGKRVRLDTDGLASLRTGRDVVPELLGKVDALSVSLNAADGETYARICPSRYGATAHRAVMHFIKGAVAAGLEVTASVVGLPEFEAAYIERCRTLAEDDLGARFRLRDYDAVG